MSEHNGDRPDHVPHWKRMPQPKPQVLSFVVEYTVHGHTAESALKLVRRLEQELQVFVADSKGERLRVDRSAYIYLRQGDDLYGTPLDAEKLDEL